VLDSGTVDLVLLQLGTNADPSAAVMAEKLTELRDTSPVPFLVGRLGAPALAPAALEIYAAAGIPVFRWPEQLAAAAAASVTFGTVLSGPVVSGAVVSGAATRGVRT